MWYWVFAVVIALAILAVVRWLHVSNFQKKATVGDSCIIYINNDKFKAYIIEARTDLVVVTCMGGTYSRYRSDIYPV